MVTGGDAPAERAKGPGFKLSAAVLVGGIVVAIPGVLVCAIGFWHTVFGPTFLVPGTTHLHRGTGTYIVFERTGNRSTYGPLTIARDDGVTIDSRQLLVTGPDGRSVRVVSSSPNESINRGSDHYTSAVEFDAPRAGESTLRLRTTEHGEVMVQRPLGDLFRRRVPWIVDIVMGWLIALVGVTLLIIGVSRRGRATRATRIASGSGRVATAAWFPDPFGQRCLRFWDGTQWTDDTAD